MVESAEAGEIMEKKLRCNCFLKLLLLNIYKTKKIDRISNKN